MVDTFAEARQNDILNLAEEMEEDIEKDRLALQKLFSRIDKDGSGQLSLDELIQGLRVAEMGLALGEISTRIQPKKSLLPQEPGVMPSSKAGLGSWTSTRTTCSSCSAA